VLLGGVGLATRLRLPKMTSKRKKPSWHGKRDPQTDQEWDELAHYRGVESGQELKEQIRLCDEIMTKIILEEKEEEDRRKLDPGPVEERSTQS